MKTIFCKKGRYLFGENGEEAVLIQTLAFKIPWRRDDDIFKNQFSVQAIADLIEKVYIYERCFGGVKYKEFLCNEGAYIAEFSHKGLMEIIKEFERYTGTFDCSIDKEPNFVVFDRMPWRTEVYNDFNTGIDYLKMWRRIGARNFNELPDLTKIDNED